MSKPIIPRPAATLVLLRDTGDGPETLMLQRADNAVFFAGAHVFPGGAVDRHDADPRIVQRMLGLTDRAASARLGIDTGGLGYWVAAVRECFEESGILIAVDEDERPINPERVAELGRLRAPLNSGEFAFADLLESERLWIPASTLAYFAHWTTPAGPPRRFETRFFVTKAPAGQAATHDETENTAVIWARPQDALDRNKRGELNLPFPTQRMLSVFAPFTRADAAMQHMHTLAHIPHETPVMAAGRDGTKKIFRSENPEYAEIRWSDTAETGATHIALETGVPKRLDALVTRLLAPNAGMLSGPGTNTYLVGERALAVIDPGPAIDAHVAAIAKAGDGRIRWIVCTHTHPDHSPAAVALKAATGAEVIGLPAPTGKYQDRTFTPERQPAHDERLAFDGFTLRALYTPGHASNHVCYLLEETRMLFAGDQVMQGSTVVIDPPDGDMRAYVASIEMLREMDIAILAPAHGYLIGEPRKELQRLIDHRLAREARVIAGLTRLGNATIDELTPVVYNDTPAQLHPFAARSLEAHLAKLVTEQRARIAGDRYSLV